MNQNNNNNNLTFKPNAGNENVAKYIKAVAIPIAIFILALFAISTFASFGVAVIAPLTGVMWIMSAITAVVLPSHRESILKEAYIALAGYLGGLVLFRELIGMSSGISAEMMMATYNQAIPVTTGSAISGHLQNVMLITAYMVPAGYIAMLIKKIFTFRSTANKTKEFERLRGIRQNGNRNFDR